MRPDSEPSDGRKAIGRLAGLPEWARNAPRWPRLLAGALRVRFIGNPAVLASWPPAAALFPCRPPLAKKDITR